MTDVAADAPARVADRPRALIVGCGDVGTEVGLRLVAAGWDVAGARRDPTVLPPSLTRVPLDLSGDLGTLPAEVEALVFAAAPDRGAAADGHAAAYETIYRDGLARVLDRVVAAGRAPRVVFVSSTSVYGVEDGSEVDEDTPAVPTRATGRVLLDAEQLLAAASVSGISLRLGGIYGPGRTRLIDGVADGSARSPAGDHPTNRIHRDDAAAAIVHLLTGVADPAPVYLGVDHEPAQLAEVQRFLAAELGVPAPPPVSDADGAPPRGGAKRCRSDRLRSTGFRFRYPTFREGYPAVLGGEGVRHP